MNKLIQVSVPLTILKYTYITSRIGKPIVLIHYTQAFLANDRILII